LRVGDRTIQAPVDDISMGGMLARTPESIAIGTAIMFDLARPGLKKPLRLLGVVVDTRVGRGLGIRFDGLDRDGADRLGELIKDLGGMTSSLLVDKPDHDGIPPIVPREPMLSPPTALPAPAPPVARTGLTGVFQAPPQTGQTQAQPREYSELELKLQAQARSMVMELGRMQELVTQRERELHEARAEIERLKAETASGDAAQRIVGRLEIEKNKLEGQLAEQRSRIRVDAELAQREADQASAALTRMLEALKRLR
ncbi:MAG TPA: PilZ domain-containing protein, partial [Myxococcota bacterium]